MLDGWRRQQQARRLTGPFAEGRIRLVRRFREFTGAWPWEWTPAQVEEWIAAGGWAHSTVRSYEGALSGFLDYACDPRYGTDKEMKAWEARHLHRHDFHGDWNYSITAEHAAEPGPPGHARDAGT